MSDSPTCALIVSDLHLGSDCAIMRPGFVTEEGNEIGVNLVQEWFWMQMQDLLAQAIKRAAGRKYVLILNGDLIEGNHHRTKEILMVDEFEHARAAIYTIKPLVKNASHVFITEGTECHTGNLERYIGKEIGANPTKGGKYAWPILNIKIHGSMGSVRHHMPTTSRAWLTASQYSIQSTNAQIEAVRAHRDVPVWFAGAHRHKQGVFFDGDIVFAVTPSWQALTRFGRKVVPDANVRPGFVWLDWKDVEYGDPPKADLILGPALPTESIEL